MKCARLKKYMIPYVEGSLPGRLRGPMDAHLSACEPCRRELDELAQTVGVLRQAEYPAAEPAFDLRSRVMAQVAREPVRKPWWSARLPAYSAAAAGLLIFAVLLTTIKPAFREATQPMKGAEQVATAPSPEEPEALREVPAQEVGTDRTGAAWLDGHVDTVRPGRSATPMKPKEGRVPSPRAPADKPEKGPLNRLYSDEITVGTTVRLPETGDDAKVSSFSLRSHPESLGMGNAPDRLAASRNDDHAMPEGTSRDVAQAPSGGAQTWGMEHSVPAGPPALIDGVARERESIAEVPRGAGNIASWHEDSADLRADKDSVLNLERKLKEFPNSRTVLCDLLEAYSRSGQAEDEYAVATRLTKLYPENARYWFARAQAAEKAKMPKTAAASYRRAIDLKLTGPELELAKARLAALKHSPK
jgi:hypothetical protein